MSSLNIYYQAAGGLGKHQYFKSACFYSDFDIICITWSTLTKSDSDEEVIDRNTFDIFRLDYERNVEKSYHIWGSFIAVRKHLCAYVRREWMTAGVESVWVTVPSLGRHSHLHVACGRFSSADNIYPFTENLASLRKSHPHDQFLIAGLFPPSKWEWFSEQRDPIGTPHRITTGDQNREIMERLRSSTSRAGLDQFNKIKKNNDHLYNLVFSSVPVSVKPCPRPLASEKYNWGMALQFRLNIGPPEFCGTTGNVRKENSRDVDRVQREARREDINAREGVSDLIEGLKSLLDSIGEKFEQTVEELKAVQEECKRMSEENMRAQIEQREDCKKRFAMIEQRLKTLEDRGLLYWTRSGFGMPNMPFGAQPYRCGPFGAGPTFGSTTAPASTNGGVTFGFSPGQQGFGAGPANTGPLFGSGADTRSKLFGGPSAFEQNTFGAQTGGFDISTQPATTFGATSSGTNTLGFGSTISEVPLATGSFGQPQTTISGGAIAAFGAAPKPLPPVTEYSSGNLPSTNGISAFGATTLGLVGGTTAQPPTTFAAMSSGTTTLGFGSFFTQSPLATGSFSQPQTTISSGTIAAFGASPMPVPPAMPSTNGMSAFGATTLGLVGGTTAQPATTFAAVSSGTTTLWSDSCFTQSPNMIMFSMRPATGGFRLLQSTSGSALGEVVASPTPVPPLTAGNMNASTIPSVAGGTPSTTSTVAALGSYTTPTTIGQNEIADGLATTFITVPIFRETNTTRARIEHQISATTLNRKDDTSNQKRGSSTTSSESTTNVGQENPHDINGSSSHSNIDQSFDTNKESVSEPDACSVTKHARRSDDHVGDTQDKRNVGGTLS